MSKRAIRRVTVVSSERRTPHLHRVVFGGEALADFPEGMEGGYVKLLLTEATDPPDPAQVPKRAYSVRGFDRSLSTLTLEFVIHDPAGPATAWAVAAAPGDLAWIVGPGPVQPVDGTADHVLLASDLSGLPALAANLERLPPTAQGRVLIEIPDADDRQPLTAPDAVTIEWIVNPEPTAEELPLAERIRDLPWPEGRVSVWAAGEFNTIKDLRSYFRNERGLGPADLYISSYWKRGADDGEHRRAKKALAAEEAAS